MTEPMYWIKSICRWIRNGSPQAEGHKHTCLDCNRVIGTGGGDCDVDRDHDFGYCDACAAIHEAERHSWEGK